MTALAAALGRPNRELAVGGAAVLVLVAMVAAPGLLAPASPTEIDLARALQPPSAAHWFGTDEVGRDLYARLIHGARVTLGIVAGSLLAAALLGGGLGLLAGYWSGITDIALGRGADMVLSFPPLILGVVLTGILGAGIDNLALALAIVFLPVFFRIARAGTIAECEKAYVEAARAIGAGDAAILGRHILPNLLPLMLVQYAILFPLALQIEAALGFLGLGVQPPTPDWGAILEQAKNYILVAPWLSLYPGLFIAFAAFAVLLLGRGLQRRIEG